MNLIYGGFFSNTSGYSRPYFYNRELRIITEMYIRHTNGLNQLMTGHGDFVVLRNQVLPDATSFDFFWIARAAILVDTTWLNLSTRRFVGCVNVQLPI